VNYSKHRRTAVPIRNTVGHKGAGVKHILKGGLIDIPEGSLTDPAAFRDKCVLVSVMVGYLKIDNSAQYLKVKKLCYARASNADKTKATIILKTALLELCEACSISYSGPHVIDEVLPIISTQLNVQIHVIHNLDGRKCHIQSFPQGHNLDIPRIYLYLLNAHHVVLIDNLKAFFLHNKRYVCFDCKKSFGYHMRTTHRCHGRLNCFNCDGVFLTSTTKQFKHELTTFCDSKLREQQVPEFNCDKCNLTFQTLLCYYNHSLKCVSNNKGWKCLNCGIFHVAVNNQTADEIRAIHVCGETRKKCIYCFQLKEKDHICKIKLKNPHTIWPNLAFISMKHPDIGNGNCQNCFEVKKKFTLDNNITLEELFKSEKFSELVCKAHELTSVKALPSVISIFVETSRHIFKEYLFCDDNLCTNDIAMKEMLVHYANNPKPFSSIPCGNKRTAQQVSPEFDKKVKFAFSKQTMTAVDKFMQFVCTSNLRNFTFLIHDNNTFLTILENFLKLKISPDCVQQGNKINYLEVSCLQIRFLNVAMYLKGSVFDIAEQYNIGHEKYYYPQSWNKLSMLAHKGVKPELKEYFSYSDTKADRINITRFYNTLAEPWCAQSEF
jgi:hypothetical protein